MLGTLDTGLLWGNLGVSLLVVVAGAALVPALSLPDALLAIAARLRDRKRDARSRRRDRDGRARAGDGSHARAARAARVVPPDRDQRVARARLDDLRAAHHRDRRRSALGRALRFPRAVAVDARVRSLRLRAGASRPDRVRAAVRSPGRRLGRPDRGRVPHLVDARRRRPGRALGRARRRRPLGVAGSGLRRRDHGLVDSPRARLHALLDEPPRWRARHRRRLSRPGRVAARARSRARPLARPRATPRRFPQRSSPEGSPRSWRFSRCSSRRRTRLSPTRTRPRSLFRTSSRGRRSGC